MDPAERGAGGAPEPARCSRVTFITLFPEIINVYFATSIVARARSRGAYRLDVIDLNRYRIGATRQCDDAPYGGGAGMLLRPEPLAAAIDSVAEAPEGGGAGRGRGRAIVYPSASGRPLNQQSISALAAHNHLLFICGRYEGIDQRIIDHYVDYEISLGGYVLSSGELAAMVIADALIRRIPGVLNPQSLAEESHGDGLLEYPQYTRPAVWRGVRVPGVLLSGDHAKISAWRKQESIKKTIQNKLDMS